MKPRRDITLGEMQDECRRVVGHCEDCNADIRAMCDGMIGKRCDNVTCPIGWDLADPPRFNEQQMAFFRGLHGLGVKKLDKHARNGQPTAFGADGNIFYYDFLDDVEFPLDLAELLGKDAT